MRGEDGEASGSPRGGEIREREREQEKRERERERARLRERKKENIEKKSDGEIS